MSRLWDNKIAGLVFNLFVPNCFWTILVCKFLLSKLSLLENFSSFFSIKYVPRKKRPIQGKVLECQVNLSNIVLLWRWEFFIIFKAFHWKPKVKQKYLGNLLSLCYLYSCAFHHRFYQRNLSGLSYSQMDSDWEAKSSRKHRAVFISISNLIKPLWICPSLTLKLGSSRFPLIPTFPIPAVNVLVSRKTENASRSTTQTAVWWYIVGLCNFESGCW